MRSYDHAYDSYKALRTFYDQIDIAGNIARLRRRDDQRAFLCALCARPNERRKKKVIETERRGGDKR